MHAEDRDPPEMGGTVTYKFVSTPGEKERFNVDSVSGRITTADVSIEFVYPGDNKDASNKKITLILNID